MKEEEEESNRIESTVNEFFNQTVAVSLSLLEEERKSYFENEDDRNSRERKRRRRGNEEKESRKWNKMKEEEEESNRQSMNFFIKPWLFRALEEERKGYFENEDDRNSRERRRRRRGIRCDAAARECKRRSEPFRFIKFNDESPANRWHMRSLINRPRADRNGCNELSPRKGENIPGDSGKEERSNCSRSNRDAQLCSRLNFIR